MIKDDDSFLVGAGYLRSAILYCVQNLYPIGFSTDAEADAARREGQRIIKVITNLTPGLMLERYKWTVGGNPDD